MRSVTWLPSLPRLGQSASNSSKKMRQGEFSLALGEPSAPLEEAADGLLALADVLVEQLGAFDRDEVAVGCVRDGLGEHGLAAAGRPVEQHAGLQLDAELPAALWVAEGPDDGAGELGLELLQRADVFPARLGHRREAELLRQRHHLSTRLREVFPRQPRHGLSRPSARHGFEGSLLTGAYLADERVQVRRCEARRELHGHLETLCLVLRVAEQVGQHCSAGGFVQRSDLHLAVDLPRPQQVAVESLGLRRSEHREDLLPSHALQRVGQLVDDLLLALFVRSVFLARDAVDVVHYHDGRLLVHGLFVDLPDLRLTLVRDRREEVDRWVKQGYSAAPSWADPSRRRRRRPGSSCPSRGVRR